MFDMYPSQTMKKFLVAARTVLEDGVVDYEDPRCTKSIFMTGRGPGYPVLDAAIIAATRNGHAFVMLHFGSTGEAKGPRSLTVALPGGDGQPEIYRDCALFENSDGQLIIVPRGAGARGHLVFGRHGPEWRASRPAALGAGMVRAARRLCHAAREVTDVGPMVHLNVSGVAA